MLEGNSLLSEWSGTGTSSAIHGSAQGQAEWGSEQPDLVKGVPVHGRGF